MATTKARSVEAILDALRRHPNSTAAELAEAAGIGRSTAGKALAILEGEGYATRRQATPQPGAKTAPDRWSLTSQTPAGPDEPDGKPTAEPEPSGQQPATEQPPTTPVAAADQPHDTGTSQPAGAPTQAGEATAPLKAGKAGAPSANHQATAGPRLRPGELRSLVHAFLAERLGQELTPTKIGKELGRSAGAVGNALATMTDAGEVIQTSVKPRKYMLASQPSGAAETGGETVKAS
jgi:DNA-binding transcriptional MocR family regulator